MAYPTRPEQIPPHVGFTQLAHRAFEHGQALFKHRLGLAPLSDTERVAHCLAELAYATELAQQALCGRWVVAVDALAAGADPEQVAAATALDVDELHTGLRDWAHGQLRHGHMSPDRHAQVLALLPDQHTNTTHSPERGADR